MPHVYSRFLWIVQGCTVDKLWVEQNFADRMPPGVVLFLPRAAMRPGGFQDLLPRRAVAREDRNQHVLTRAP